MTNKIPQPLIQAVLSQKVSLFLGAGASLAAVSDNGQKIPGTSQLTEALTEKFLGDEFSGYPLMEIAEMAIQAQGPSAVYDHVRLLLEPYNPTDAHLLLPTFRWRAIISTNYDLLVERAYAAEKKNKLQNLVVFVKDTQSIDDGLQGTSNPLPYYKIHGSLDIIHDVQVPPVLSFDHYAESRKNRENLYGRVREIAQHTPIVFCGYSLRDAHVRALIQGFTDIDKRPTHYIVAPNIPDAYRNYWAKHNVTVIDCTFSDFMRELDQRFPQHQRAIRVSPKAIDFPMRRFYTVRDQEESDLLRQTIGRDLILVSSDMPIEEQDPQKFYQGFDTGWGAIAKKLDIKRKFTDEMLERAIIEAPSGKETQLFMLLGPGGAGKTVGLKRAAWDAAELDALALWLDPQGTINSEVVEEIYRLTGRRIFLFVNRVALHTVKIAKALKAAQAKGVPLTIIGAERTNEWNVYCDGLEEFNPESKHIGQLSENEVDELLDKLQKYDSLGILKGRPRAEQVSAFMQTAERYLLVALHEVTRGKKFEEIVFEEYERILPEQARQLYLDIATMNRFSVSVRAGIIWRISNIRFEDYKQEFFKPLEKVVLTDKDEYTRDYHYRARHAKVASLVFDQACVTEDDKVKQVLRVITGLDIGYSSDEKALLEMAKGRELAKNLNHVSSGRCIYAIAKKIAPTSPFIYQQHAIFEMLHRDGSLLEAEKVAAEARDLEPKSNVIIHTQAEVARARAKIEQSPVLKDQLRRQVRNRLDEMQPLNTSVAISTKCKLLVDEIEEIAETMHDDSSASETAFFGEKVREVEEVFRNAQLLYPDNAEVLQTEARLLNLLEQHDRAVRALERALTAAHKGFGVEIKLSTAYAHRGKTEQATNLLAKALQQDPDDKTVNLALAKLYLAQKNDAQAEIYFSRSYTKGDNNFESRFLHAQLLFLMNKKSEALALFDEIDRRAPKQFRAGLPKSDTAISERLPRYNGNILRRQMSFLFIRSTAYERDIYARDKISTDVDWYEFSNDAEVNFRLRFNRKGPFAVDIKLGEIRTSDQAAA